MNYAIASNVAMSYLYFGLAVNVVVGFGAACWMVVRDLRKAATWQD